MPTDPYKRAAEALDLAVAPVKPSQSKPASDVKPGPAKQRSPEEVAAARKAADNRATDIQNVRAYNYSMRNKPGAQKMVEPYEGKKFEENKPIRKLPSRSSSRR